MQWPGILRHGLSPILSIGIVAASLFTVATHQPGIPAVDAAAISAKDDASALHLWDIGEAKVWSPVEQADLVETGDITAGTWVETRFSPATVGQVSGKLLVSREFGPSDEADAAHIVNRPASHLVAITMAFKPFAGNGQDWFWARFSPDGQVLDTKGTIPLSIHLAALAREYCSAPHAPETAARG